jgi:hypothetical protein
LRVVLLITARVRREALLIRVEVRDLPPLTLSQQGGEAGAHREVVLVGVPGLQQPHPRRQLRVHIQDPLASSDQLLGEQVTQATSALDRPGPLPPRRRPLDQLAGLRSRGPDPQLTQRLFCRPITTAVCEPLCGSTPIITAAICTLQVDHQTENVAGMPNYRSASVMTEKASTANPSRGR